MYFTPACGFASNLKALSCQVNDIISLNNAALHNGSEVCTDNLRPNSQSRAGGLRAAVIAAIIMRATTRLIACRVYATGYRLRKIN